MENEKILIAEAVVNIKILATKLGELNASHDTNTIGGLCNLFTEIEEEAKKGAYHASYVYWSKHAGKR